MRVIERVEQIKKELQDITEAYCENCQEFVCDYCPIVWREADDEVYRADVRDGWQE